jgi:hypothetical protein
MDEYCERERRKEMVTTSTVGPKCEALIRPISERLEKMAKSCE